MSSTVNSHFAATVSLSDASQPLPLPKNFVVEVDLIYPDNYHPDRDLMVDQLLRNSSIYQTPPFALITETEQKLIAPHPSLVHEKISYQLEPQLPGKFALTFYEISFVPNDSSQGEPVGVPSTIVYVDVVLPEASVIKLDAEAAPFSTLSERIPIEMNNTLRIIISQDQSTHNLELFKNRELPWHFVGGFLFLLFLLSCTALLYKYSQRKKPVELDLNRKSPLDEAEKLLQKLKGQPALDSDVVQEFVGEIITSLRNYLESDYGIPASALTSQELLDEVEKHPRVDLGQKESIREVLQLADQIKFGGYKPSMEECVKIYAVAQNMN
jgi:hypothetical protein